MRVLKFAGVGDRLTALCIGAHSDDIEIGAGATILSWIAAGWRLHIHWAVLSADGQRADEAASSARAFCEGAEHLTLDLAEFRDGFFPYDGTVSYTHLRAHETRHDLVCR